MTKPLESELTKALAKVKDKPPIDPWRKYAGGVSVSSLLKGGSNRPQRRKISLADPWRKS